MKKGYVGYSRSVRSEEAIRNNEMPISQITKEKINSFLKENYEDYKDEELELLKKQSLAIWKFVAKEKIQRKSWHHTSKFYNKTNHYRLSDIADWIIDNEYRLKEEYQDYKSDKRFTIDQLIEKAARQEKEKEIWLKNKKSQ